MRHVILCILLGLLGASVPRLAAQQANITVQVDKPGAAISPLLYGVFFEEIHRAGEGGVYAEKVMNRSFEEGTVGWSVVRAPGSAGTMEADRKSLPINPRNPTALKLTITEVAGGRVGVANGGFWNPANGDGWSKWFYASRQSHFSGFDVRRGSGYRFSLYARSAVPLQKPLSVTLERSDGTVLAASQLTGVGTTWMQFTGTFTSAGDEPNARLVVAAGETGTLWLDMVSVFPVETYRGLPFRTDLMEMLAAMRPGFLRFPGGTFIQGNHFEEAFHWKETIGDVAQRVARPGFWGYTVDRGMGFHEYLLMAEALGAEPLFCCYAGMGPGVTVSMDKMPQLVQDALDAIEYANGDARTTTWGAERAKNGHPTSFHLKLIEIGNENWGATYRERYLMFFNAIKARYPYVRIITSEGALVGGSAPVEILDKHHYEGPDWFVSHGVDYLAKEGKANIDNYAWLEANPELGNMGGAKVGGQGEVDILFNASNPKRINGWSLGAKDDKTGVANTQHGVRWDWHPKRWLPNGGLENGRWYDVRVEVRAGAIHCFLDNQLKEETFYPQAHTKILHVTAGRIHATGETVIKVVNVAEVAQETSITLAGMPVTPSLIRSTELSAEFITDVNSFDQPTKISPREHVIPIAGSSFTYTFPASSVTVLRIGR